MGTVGIEVSFLIARTSMFLLCRSCLTPLSDPDLRDRHNLISGHVFIQLLGIALAWLPGNWMSSDAGWLTNLSKLCSLLRHVGNMIVNGLKMAGHTQHAVEIPIDHVGCSS